MAARRKQRRRGAGFVIGAVLALLVAAPVTFLGASSMWLVLYNVIPPPVTGVQVQRAVESLWDEEPFRHSYRPVGGSSVSVHLRRAVVAAEDGRFYQHAGLDLEAIREAVEDNRRRGSAWRGGSTITQQLVKNLFMTTHRSYVRKALEVPLALVADVVLPKERILTLYLNIVEWDRGVYGAQAAAQHYYGIPASELSRYQSAALAACLPNPRGRSPQSMGAYTNIILTRMNQMGW